MGRTKIGGPGVKVGVWVRGASWEGEWERVESDIVDGGVGLVCVCVWQLLGRGCVVGVAVACLVSFCLCDDSPACVYVCLLYML